MAKRKITKYATMAEVEEILKHLTQQDQRLTNQDRMLDDISKVIKGSVSLNLQGVLPMVNEMKDSMHQIVSDVAHLQRWKKREQESKGTFTIRTSVMITRLLAGIGAIGVIVGAVLGGLQILEMIQKSQTDKPKTEINK